LAHKAHNQPQANESILAYATIIISLQRSSAPALGQIITVLNFSFEIPVLTLDPSASVGATNWLSIGTTYTDNPPGASFTGAAGSSTPVGGDGQQSGFLRDSASF
jgi:hypothetical protein